MSSGDSVKLSDHARERCVEMGVRTGVVKRIVRDHKVSWCTSYRNGGGSRIVASSNEFPTITVVYVGDTYPPIVVTVLWRTPDRYDRTANEPVRELAS